jgi:hypothetical protein
MRGYFKIKKHTAKRLASIVLMAVLLFGSVLMFIADPTTAQSTNSSSGYLVSPVREELTISRGQSQKVTLTIENATQISSVVKAVVNDFEASDDESGQPRILLDNSAVSGNSFKSLVGELPDIALGSLQKQQLDVTISVPNDASAGGYYGAIRFINAALDNEQNVALAASVGTIFLVQVPGDLTESLELVEFTPAKNGSNGRFFVNGADLDIVTRLRNTGNIHIKPFGKVTITDRSGKVIETYEFNDTEPRANVLPDSIRRFEDKLGNQKWFGKYTVTANLGYGTTGSLITATSSFWVIPLWIIIVAAVVVLAILVGGYFIYRKIDTRRKYHNRLHLR